MKKKKIEPLIAIIIFLTRIILKSNIEHKNTREEDCDRLQAIDSTMSGMNTKLLMNVTVHRKHYKTIAKLRIIYGDILLFDCM